MKGGHTLSPLLPPILEPYAICPRDTHWMDESTQQQRVFYSLHPYKSGA